MPKVAKPLTAIEVKNLAKPGAYSVGTVAGLRLYIKPTGAKSWVLRTMVGSRRAEIGLGGYPTATLAQAIERARAALDDIRAGTDPAAARRAKRTTIEWTFKRAAEKFIEHARASWKNEKHAGQWTATLETYVFPKFGHKHVRDVDKADVLAAIEPIWSTKHETATRIRNRIEQVLDWAMQRGYRPDGPNPARWRGNLDKALRKPASAARVKHHEAMPIDDVHAFVKGLREAEGMGARALEFAILTAARSGEVRGATWPEIDLDAAVWEIGADRMKSSRPHRVPLSDRAVELLRALPRFERVALVFPGQGGKPLSDMTLTATMRRMGLEAVPHGFRSTFRDWAAERTSTPHEVAEMALSHAVGSKTEAAYRRGDLFDKRRTLMSQWAKFIATPPAKGNVRALRSGPAS